MSAIYLASLLLAAQPEAAARSPLFAPPAVILPDRPLSAAELRQAHSAAMRQSYRAGVWESVPELVKVIRLLEQDKQLRSADRADLRFKARSRLLTLGDQIVADVRRERTRQRQQEAAEKRGFREPLVAPPPVAVSPVALSSRSGKPSDYAAADARSRSGGLGEDEGEALVELIRSTIAPDTWDTAGGPGTIYYWKQWQVLVVRQTEEVHWLIGGFRGALGK
jgi:hypothetical protein